MLFTLFSSQRFRVPESEQIKGNTQLFNCLPEDILSALSLRVFKRFGQVFEEKSFEVYKEDRNHISQEDL